MTFPEPRRELVRILLVEDNDGDADLVREGIERDNAQTVALTTVDSLKKAVAAIEASTFDIVLLDLGLPDSRGLVTLQTIRRVAPEAKVFVLTGLDDPEIGARCIEMGAQNYLVKGWGAGAVSGVVLNAVANAASFRTLEVARADLEQRIEERTSQLAAANRDLEAFSYSISHDLRAPLRAIDGYSRILSAGQGERLDEEGRRLLGIIRGETQRMARLIEGLLDFSRLGRQSMRARPVDMTALAETALEEVCHPTPDLKRFCTIAPLSPAYGEPMMLRQVWVNLLGNAVKFSRHQTEPRIEVGSFGEDGRVTWFVKDNGAGFDMAHAAKLFGVFQRLHSAEEFDGTGIGLAFAQRIVQRHGGQIWATGAPDQGATFYFTLPPHDSLEA